MRTVLLSTVLLLFGASSAVAQISSQLVTGGLSFPVAVVQDPTQANVQFVAEQGGKIRVVRNGALEPSDFLDISPLVSSGGERGLLGLAFAPDYATSRRFFVNYTREPDGHTVISRYLRSAGDPRRADPATRFDLRWPDGNTFIFQPFANHNGGDLQFGSDGHLYIPLGDGGGGNDPDHRAQNPGELLGKMLRINVAVPDADFEGYDVPADNPFAGLFGVRHEIWAFGLRNPFRVTVDAISRGGNGAIVIADVGQNAWEEVNYEPFGARGRNYGWRNREGAHDNVTTLPPAYLPLTDPLVEYSHAVGNVITGGVVYRGTGLGVALWGRYFYADFGSRHIWSVGVNVNPVTREAVSGVVIDHTGSLGGADVVGHVSSFGLGANCEVFFLSYLAGELRQIVNLSSGAPAGCPTSPDPYLSAGGGVFVAGAWFTRDHPMAAGAGLAGVPPTGGSTSCFTPQPVSTWLCIGGGWIPPDHPLAGAPPPGPPPPPPPPPPAGGCTTVQPVSTWVCIGGGWVPPDHPLAGLPPGPPPPPPPPPPPLPTGGCTTIQPVSTWLCIGGGWVPPDHPLARGG
jgi:glucose/arabinose dehydrogenase